jgi:hypothetical protein
MNINDDNTILRKIEKNSINYYGSDATNLIKENSLLRKLIDFYQNHIEISKNKIINYFQTDNKFLKEILMYDINQFNKELQDFNIKIKNENLKLQNKINEFNKNIISNIQKINEENDKLKEDNFILLNENKSRDSIIKILTKEKLNFIGLELIQEIKRTTFNYDQQKIITFLGNELRYYQDKLTLKAKRHNHQIKRVHSLDKTKSNLINSINSIIDIKKSSPDLKVKKNEIEIKNPIYKLSKKIDNEDDILYDNNIFFADFEEDSIDELSELGLENINTDVNLNDNFENKITISENNSPNPNHNRIKSLFLVPKLNLKQIEFNKSKITQKNFHRKINSVSYFGEDKNIDNKIEDIKFQIKEIKEKNKQLKNVITKFEEFYIKIQNKIKVEEIANDKKNNPLLQLKDFCNFIPS